MSRPRAEVYWRCCTHCALNEDDECWDLIDNEGRGHLVPCQDKDCIEGTVLV